MRLFLLDFGAVPGPLRLCRQHMVQRLLAWVLLLGCGPLVGSGCNYYRTQTRTPDVPELSRLAERKQFIVHQGTQTWQLALPHLEGQTLVGNKIPPAPELPRFLDPTPKATNRRYRHKENRTVLNLVHLYLAPAAPNSPDGPVQLPLASIQRLDIVSADEGRTIASYMLGGVGVAVGVFVILGVIVALTKSSCPFVYADNGQGYEFVGEAYGGAIFKPAERDDYLPLPAIVPTAAGEYRVKISNELKERQYTNLAELWAVDHPAGTQVLADSAGQLHTLRRPQGPLLATSGAGLDRTAQLRATDHDAVLFNDPTPGTALNQLALSFARPAGARCGKLVLRAQNSLWLDYLYGQFIEQFGSYYPTWAAQQHDLPTRVNARWAEEQHIPLRVYCRTAQGWQLAGTVPTVGPLAARNLVVPMEFGPGSGPVQVRLETGFMFWEVDYAALDCTPDEPVQLAKCTLQSARTEHGIDERAALTTADENYLLQPRPGSEVSLRYRPQQPVPAVGCQRTVLLRTRGYYEHVRDFKGLPDVPALLAFRQPGHFVEFSKETYQHYALPDAPSALASARP